MLTNESLKFIDLHVHTTCSDGTLSPEDVVEAAYREKIGILAITDHDNVSGISRAFDAAKKYGIKIIPGIECSTECETGTLHILGYNIDPNSRNITEFIKKCQKNRVERIYKIIQKLNCLGFDITYDEVYQIDNKGTIGRPHIARAMLEKGYINSIKECFEKYIGRDAVVELIDSMAGEELKFDKYPSGAEYLQTLRNKMTEMIKNNI